MGFGTAIDDPKDFIIVMLNGITAAGLYFVVASGFTLIFGLMRVVNMAHGSFFLFGGYIALRCSATWSGRAARSASRAQVSVVNWVVPFIVGTLLVGVVGVVMQQVLLRWNQGEDLRQALITIARLDHLRRPDARSTSAASPRASPGRAGSTTSSTCTSRACSTRRSAC